MVSGCNRQAGLEPAPKSDNLRSGLFFGKTLHPVALPEPQGFIALRLT